MLNLASIAKSLRIALGRFTSEPDVAVLAFGLIDKNGNIVAQADATTKQLATSVALLAASGAIPLVGGGKYAITKGSLAALTLAAPSAAQNGIKVEVFSTTAFAHTITATTLLNDGTSGVPHTTATFAAHAGATITLEAYGGLWQVMSNNNVTIS